MLFKLLALASIWAQDLLGVTRVPAVAYTTIWSEILQQINQEFIGGFSSAKKCTMEGRALMQLDYRQYVLLPFSLSRVLSLSRSLSLRRSMSGWVSVCLYVCVCVRVPLPLLPRFSVCLYVCSGTQHVDSHTRSDLAIPSNALSFV